jgi:predicted permease
MSLDVALWALCLLLGIVLQRRGGHARLNERLWRAYFFSIAPAIVLFAYSTVTVDRSLVASLLLVAVTSWAVLGLALAYGALVARSRAERGAIALCSAWGNSAALGYPLTQLAFGSHGLALQALFAQFAFGVPAVAVSTTVARTYGAAAERPTDTRRGARLRTALLANPPLLVAVVAVALRVAGVDLRAVVTPLGHAAGRITGLVGFLQLGLSMPLHRVAHDAGDLRRAAGVLVLRHAVAPLLLVASAAALGVDVPAVFVLGAALPVAFHLVTLAAVFDVRPDLVRLLVVVSTIGGVAAIVAGVAVFG